MKRLVYEGTSFENEKKTDKQIDLRKEKQNM